MGSPLVAIRYFSLNNIMMEHVRCDASHIICARLYHHNGNNSFLYAYTIVLRCTSRFERIMHSYAGDLMNYTHSNISVSPDIEMIRMYCSTSTSSRKLPQQLSNILAHELSYRKTKAWKSIMVLLTHIRKTYDAVITRCLYFWCKRDELSYEWECNVG